MVVMTPADDHGTDRAVAGIGDQDGVIGADSDVLRVRKAGDRRDAGVVHLAGDAVGRIIPVEAPVAAAGKNIDDAVCGHHADGIVARDGDIDLAGGIHRQPRRQMEVGLGGEPGVAPEARGVDLAVTGERGDDALGVHFADAIVQRIGDVDIARGIERDSLRRVQLRVDRGTAVARETGARIARHQG